MKNGQFAIENGPVEIVDLPSLKSMVDLSHEFFVSTLTRGRVGLTGGENHPPRFAVSQISNVSQKYRKMVQTKPIGLSLRHQESDVFVDRCYHSISRSHTHDPKGKITYEALKK